MRACSKQMTKDGHDDMTPVKEVFVQHAYSIVSLVKYGWMTSTKPFCSSSTPKHRPRIETYVEGRHCALASVLL